MPSDNIYSSHNTPLVINLGKSMKIKLGWVVESRLVGPRPVGKGPSVGGGVFLRDHNSYLPEFRRKPRKTTNG